MARAVMIYLTGVFFSSLAQILLKREANKEHKNWLSEYLNPNVISGYAIIFGCTMMTILAYRHGLPMSWANVLESCGYVFVTIFGVTLLHEKVSPKKWAALGIILFGIVLFAVSG